MKGVLEHLSIRNLALVTELDMDFSGGLNTVTGETGAGKSLVIGAVQLLVGSRAAPGLIRKGARSCEVAGVVFLGSEYENLYGRVSGMLEEAGIARCEERRLLIRRVVSESGSRAYVNGSMVTAGFLKELCENIIELHGPNDNQALLKPSHQLEMLDSFAGLEGLAGQVRDAWGALCDVRRQLEALKAGELNPEDGDLLEYQLNEIESAGLEEGEEERLLARYRVASNSRRLLQLAVSVQNALCDGEGSISEQIAAQVRSLHELSQLDPDDGSRLLASLEEIGELVGDLGSGIADYASGLDMDQEELQRMEERLDLIQKLKRKYGPGVDGVLETAARIRKSLEALSGRSGRIEELERREGECLGRFQELARTLSKRRRESAGPLSQSIEGKLHALGFQKAAFNVAMAEAVPGPSGGDAVEFEFAANVGEDMQPLRAVASSGEVARVMLAVKTVLCDADNVPVLIFDEIDANVGGRVAVSVAGELLAVGRRHQVFSITHMPQIAAAGQHHYLVSKHVVGDRTETVMRRIEGDERLAEIVRMLGAEPGSTSAVAHAKALLAREG